MNQCKYLEDCNSYIPGGFVCNESKDKSDCIKFGLLDSIAREHDAALMKKIKRNDILESRFNTYIFAIGSIGWAFTVYAIQTIEVSNIWLIISITMFVYVFICFIQSIENWVK